MKWIVKNNNGILKFQNIVVCSEGQYNKLTADVNQQVIKNWCNDNHVKHNVSKDEQYLSILSKHTKEINESEARSIDKTHTDFLKFIDNLPEVDVQEEGVQSQQEIVEFAKDVLDSLHKGEISGAALIMPIGSIGIPCGGISHKVLIQMFETWLDKYSK